MVLYEHSRSIADAALSEKADHFFKAMMHLSSDLNFSGASVGLLAVHSAISLNDAIIAATSGKRNKGEDHSQAAAQLKKLCGLKKIHDLRGIEHFRWLLAKKSLIAYGDERISEADLKLSVDKAQRFSDWAYKTVQRGAACRRSLVNGSLKAD